MIKSKTVLILGAGASAPYGFPLGRSLLLRICRQLRDVDEVAAAMFRQWPEKSPDRGFPAQLLRCGFRFQDLGDFREQLQQSMQPSVDAFLENNPKYVDIGKAAIAASLIPAEVPSNLLRKEGEDLKWYEYLFNQLGARKDEFRQNSLSIVTFNYDRSLEYFLFCALKNSYGLSDKEAADLLTAIPIVHVYGMLGQPDFLTNDGRPYSPEVTAETIKKCASEIKIIHELSGSTDELERAHSFTKDAEIVCFLGFGYHPINVERLHVNDLIRPPARLLGSAFELGLDEVRRAGELFKPYWQRINKTVRPKYFILGDSDEDALKFIKNKPVFA